MQKLENIFRRVFFLVFSAAGICAVALTVLGPEWKSLYQMEAAVKQTEQNNRKIEEIIKDHQMLSAQISKDANILKRLAPLELGEQLDEPNQPVAKITADTLARAKAVLEQQQTQDDSDSSGVPKWLQRCTTAENRIILFAAGAGLVVISFACFGRKEDKKVKK
jgi:DNA-directed RNA polymerase sigma subunit (sigma70/sigma32)